PLMGIAAGERPARVVDAGGPRRRPAAGRCATREHQERHRWTDRQRRCSRTLVRANRETKQILIEPVRACGVAGKNREVTQISEREQTLFGRRLDSAAHVPEWA